MRGVDCGIEQTKKKKKQSGAALLKNGSDSVGIEQHDTDRDESFCDRWLLAGHDFSLDPLSHHPVTDLASHPLSTVTHTNSPSSSPSLRSYPSPSLSSVPFEPVEGTVPNV